MKILITGSRGNFPTALIPRLAMDGHSLVLLDIEPMGAPENSVAIQGDVRDAGLVAYAMHGVDAVVHAAGLHGTSVGRRNYDDFYSVNVTGLHNVLRGMLLNGVKSLVFSSCDSVYGDGARGHLVIDETTPTLPVNFYAETKLLGEDMCQFYSRKHGFKVAALRYGKFSAADWKAEGIGRLNNHLDRDDVAQANLLALAAVMEDGFGFETFLIEAATRFTESDWPGMTIDTENVIEIYYPGAVKLLHDNDLRVPHVHHRYDITKAVTMLGYDPQNNFEQFLDRLRTDGRQNF